MSWIGFLLIAWLFLCQMIGLEMSYPLLKAFVISVLIRGWKIITLNLRFWLLSQKFVCLTDEISVINVMIYCMLLKLFTLIMPTNESFDIHRIYGQETRPQKIIRWIFIKKNFKTWEGSTRSLCDTSQNILF